MSKPFSDNLLEIFLYVFGGEIPENSLFPLKEPLVTNKDFSNYQTTIIWFNRGVTNMLILISTQSFSLLLTIETDSQLSLATITRSCQETTHTSGALGASGLVWKCRGFLLEPSYRHGLWHLWSMPDTGIAGAEPTLPSTRRAQSLDRSQVMRHRTAANCSIAD